MTYKLAIIDWGIGGISVKKRIFEMLGDVPTIYFSDTGATPYGKMSRGELAARLDAVIEFLKARGATHLVIGCNAASTAIPHLKDHGIPIEGVIETAVAATVKLKPKRLGLIGGRRTVLSGVYRRSFAKHGIKPKQRIAQPLSGLIESGDVSSITLREHCRHILTPVKNSSHILLACTHYAAIQTVMSDFVSPETVFVDPVPQLVDLIKKWNLPRRRKADYLTTGDPEKMKSAAMGAFGWRIEIVEKVKL